MSKPLIVGLGHRKRTGKDLFGEFLCESLKAYGSTADRSSFAWSLKSVCNQLYGWAGMRHGDFYELNPSARDEILAPLGKSPRQVWIEVGNKLRDVYPLTWIQSVLGDECYADVLIVRDVRYPNEVDAIRERGGLLIKIERPDVRHTDDVADCALDGFDGWDHVIVNDGPVGRLKERADDLVNGLILPAMDMRQIGIPRKSVVLNITSGPTHEHRESTR